MAAAGRAVAAGAGGGQGAPSTRTLFLSVFPSIMVPMFLAAVDQTIVATALPAIAGALGDVERISWVVVSYLVANTIAAPVYGKLGDSLGRRPMMLVALAVFIAASVLCAVSTGILMLTFARVLQGIGGGGLMTLSQALIGESVPPRERGKFQGYLSATFVCASTFGPVAGGYLTQHFGWQSVFLVNVPVGLAAMLLALRLPAHPGGGGRMQFDFWGVLFFSTFIAPALLALEQAQHFDPAALPGVIAFAAIAAVSLAMLLRQERRAPSPLLPLKLLRQAAIWRTDTMAALLAAVTVATVSFLPMYYQVVRGATPAETGLLMLPMTAGIGIGSLFTGRMIARTGRTTIFPSFGLAITAVTLAVLAALAPHLTTGQLPWAFLVVSLSVGTGMPVAQITVQSVAGPKLLGAASASVQFSRSVGAAFGTAIVGAVLFALLAAQDPETAARFAELVQQGPRVLAALPEARRVLVQGEIAFAFRGAFLTIALFAAASWGLARWIPVRRI
jgi:EmrB/QacA subfamily drug resistance transporter